MKSINAMYHEDLIKLTSKTLAKNVANTIINDATFELAKELNNELREMYNEDIKTPRYVIFSDLEIDRKTSEMYKDIEEILYRFIESNEGKVKFDNADVSMATSAFFDKYEKAKEAIFNGVLGLFRGTTVCEWNEETLSYDDPEPWVFEIRERGSELAIIRIKDECRDEYPLWLYDLSDNVYAFRDEHNK